MTPVCLKADARRIILRGVAKLVAHELTTEIEFTANEERHELAPEHRAARDAIAARWTREERDVRKNSTRHRRGSC
jgi:hypothetical protein